jgi:hypothetical protein
LLFPSEVELLLSWNERDTLFESSSKGVESGLDFKFRGKGFGDFGGGENRKFFCTFCKFSVIFIKVAPIVEEKTFI